MKKSKFTESQIVNLETRTAVVTRTLVWRKGGGWFFGEPKTTRSRQGTQNDEGHPSWMP